MFKKALYVIFILYCLYPHWGVCKEKNPMPVEWESPLPKVTQSNIDLREVEKIAGENGQFIFLRDPQKISVWTQGEVVDHDGGVVVTAMKIVHAPLEKTREVIRDYSLISQIQSQHRDIKKVSQKGPHTLYRYNQEYKLGIITLKSDFLMQQTLESDGSISLLLHEGDVDAQIQRWEFVALDEERTMVMLTFWSAYHTSRFAFKIIMSAMQESYVVAPVMYCSMYLEQYTRYLEKDWPGNGPDKNVLYPKPSVPRYKKLLSERGKTLIESLVENGMVFLRTFQYMDIDNETRKVPFVTTFDILEVPPEKVSPVIADIDNFTDSISIVKSIKKKELPEGDCVRVNYRMARFPVAIPLFTQQTYEKVLDNYLPFENKGQEGAYYPYLGAYEWDTIDKKGAEDATLYILTQAFKVGPDANFYIRTLGKLMTDSENVQILTSSIIMVRNRIKWIEKNYKCIPESQRSSM